MMTPNFTVIFLICVIFVRSIASIETIQNIKQRNEKNNTQISIDNLKSDIIVSTKLSLERNTPNETGGVEKAVTVC